MKPVRISDITLKQKSSSMLTYKEKVELVKLLDRLGVDVIETGEIGGSKADALCIKSYSQTVRNSTIAVQVGFGQNSIEMAADALKEAKKARLQVACPASSVQMEYGFHAKQDKMKEIAAEGIRKCRDFCEDVEFIALDATRADKEFLYDLLETCIEAGAKTVTVCDDAGCMLPEEFGTFLKDIFSFVKNIKDVCLAVRCCDKLAVADICSVYGIDCGAGEIKASVHPEDAASLKNLVRILETKGEMLKASSAVKTIEMKRIIAQVDRFFTESRSAKSPFEDGVRDEREDRSFTSNDGISEIVKEIHRLGYDLSDEDNKTVYDAFCGIAAKKEKVSSRELEAIIASNAGLVPPTYKIQDYIINSGNVITATSHIRLLKNGKVVESVSVGDGPVDASFLAIEQITGHHYELDDFQIQSITEGREAMGETIVRLRSGGKLYSGRGLSTDIIGSSIRAYVNALNKIVYEEEQE